MWIWRLPRSRKSTQTQGYVLSPSPFLPDPVMMAIAAYPGKPVLMAKQEIIQTKTIRWFINWVLSPVNRENQTKRRLSILGPTN